MLGEPCFLPTTLTEDQGLGFPAVCFTAGGNDLALRDVTENTVCNSNFTTYSNLGFFSFFPLSFLQQELVRERMK